MCETYFSFVGTKVIVQRAPYSCTKLDKQRKIQASHRIENESCEDMKGRTFTGSQLNPDYKSDYSYLKHRATSALACIHNKGSEQW